MTRLFLPEPVFDENSTFKNDDKLGRSDLSLRLTDLVDRIDDPMVIALDGGWARQIALPQAMALCAFWGICRTGQGHLLRRLCARFHRRSAGQFSRFGK
jgi:hypothetical protein